MIEKDLAILSNYLWKKSITNIDRIIGQKNNKEFTNTDYFNLSTIFYLGKPNFSQIASALNVTKPAVSLIVKRLERLQLVERIQSEADKRIYYVKVTALGQQIIRGDEKEYSHIAHVIREAAGDEEKYQEIEQVLSQVIKRIQEENDGGFSK